MNTSQSYANQRKRGQSMVEFALTIPVLLMLLYGLLETGRLLFIYASTVTAARQAVRYGSATGTISDGVTHYYEDCTGITAAAHKVGFINRFDSVSISYDGGFDSGGTINHLGDTSPDLTPYDPDCGEFTDPQNGDRVIVEVTTQWEPIVPIIPLKAFEIRSQSERTILSSISLSVTPVAQGPQNGNNASGQLVLSTTASPTTFSTVGQKITYTYNLSNTGAGDLTAPFTVSDDVAATSCSSAPATLTPGSSFNCTGTYTTKQTDLDTGAVKNTATASANGVSSNTSTAIVPAIQLPAITLSKSAYPIVASAAGTNITYTYTLTNTGNVTLTSPYNVIDDKIPSGINCSGAASPLAPSASTTCTASYSITDADLNNGSVINQAVASATFKSTTIPSNTATATVSTSSLILAISASPLTVSLPNQVISYVYTVTNNSGTTANSLSITDSRVTVNCPTTTIPPKGSINCTGTYTVTPTDYNVGGVITNSAKATANIGYSISSKTETASVAITQIPALSVAVSASPSQPISPAPTIPAGTVITYTYVMTNTGNVTFSSPFLVTDNKSTITCSDQSSLAPGATKNCTGTYTVTTNDVNAGSITNTGTAAATFNAQIILSNSVSATVITFSEARFSLALSASPGMITQGGTPVIFTYTITNTGGKLLTSPYSITSSLLGTFSCSGASPLALGASTSCQNTYAPSSTITNTITAASAFDGTTSVPSSNLPTVTVPYNICTIQNLTLSVAPDIFKPPVKIKKWIITNNVGAPLHIASLEFNWNATANNGINLTSVHLSRGATSIWSWSGVDGSGYFKSSFNTPLTIDSGATDLTLNFSKQGMNVTGLKIMFAEAGCGPLGTP